MLKFSNAIPGSVASGDWVSVVNPYSREEVGEVELSGLQEIEVALTKAQAIFIDRKRWLSAAKRIQILEEALVIMTARFEELVLVALSEGGKPLIDSRIEVSRAIDGVRNCIDCIRNEGGAGIPMGTNAASEGRLAVCSKEPIGVVVAVSAFNHPLNLIVHQVGPAIAAGCPVIVKPARETALSCFSFVEILREAGLPDDYCIPMLTDSNESTEVLIGDGRVAFLSFIGSANVGWSLRSKLAPGARCALEHGGVAPVIITPDADLERALPMIAKGGYYHAGQVCVSVQRVYAHSSIAKRVAYGLADIAATMVVGDPKQEATEVGPLIRQSEVHRVNQWVEEAVEEGALLVCGGKAKGDSCYEPTVLFDASDASKVSCNEIFGPVIVVYSYHDLDSALARANGLKVAFQAAVFTKNIDDAMYIQRNLNASTVMLNDHTAFRVDWMPFAGLRESGHGVGGIPYTFEDMQVNKLLVIHSPGLID